MRMVRTDMKKNNPAVRQKKNGFRRWQTVCFTVIIGAAILFLTAGCVFGVKVRDFSHSVTIQADENGFDMEMLKEMMADPEPEYTFAAWKEETGRQISAAESGRSDTANVIEIYGPSYCVLPYGANLCQEDKDACLIGRKLSEQLFGGYQVEGQQIQYNGRMLTIRGVIKEPGEMLICETTEPETGFNRISILAEAGEGYLKAKDFISGYSLAAQPLRFDLYQNLAWIQEMIPGKWSDFDGWKENIKEKRQEFQFVSGAAKSNPELLYLGWVKRRNLYWALGIGCIGCYLLWRRCK